MSDARHGRVRGSACSCLQQGPALETRAEVCCGIDTTHGRFGEVARWSCTLCGRVWLRYFVEYEAYSSSGRWFMGLVSADCGPIAPHEAVETLASLSWYLAGGSYFDGVVARRSGPPPVDL